MSSENLREIPPPKQNAMPSLEQTIGKIETPWIRPLAPDLEKNFVPGSQEASPIIIPRVTERIQAVQQNPRKLIEGGQKFISGERDRIAKDVEQRALELSMELHAPVLKQEIDRDEDNSKITVEASAYNQDTQTYEQYHWITGSRIVPNTKISVDLKMLAKHFPNFVAHRIEDFYVADGLKEIFEMAERDEKERTCITFETTQISPAVYPFTQDMTFETEYIVGAQRHEDRLVIPRIEERIQEEASSIVNNAPKEDDMGYEMRHALSQESLHLMNTLGQRAKDVSETMGIQLIENVPQGKELTIKGSSETGYSMTIQTSDQETLDINITKLATHDPEFVSEYLKDVLVLRGVQDIMWSAYNTHMRHAYGNIPYTFLLLFDNKPERRTQEIAMIHAFLEAVGGIDRKKAEEIRQKLDAYKPTKPSLYRNGAKQQLTVGGHLEHAQRCPIEPEENIPAITKAREISNSLATMSIEPLENPFFMNPRSYTKESIIAQGNQLTYYIQVNNFIKQTREIDSFQEYMNTMAKKNPSLYRDWARLREEASRDDPTFFEKSWVEPLVVSQFEMKEVEKRIRVTYPPLEDLSRLIILKYIKDRIQKQHASFDPHQGKDDRVAKIQGLVTTIENKIQARASNPEKQKIELAKKLRIMQSFLATNNITQEAITQLLKTGEDNVYSSGELKFAIAFHLYRLHKQNNVDMNSLPFREAVNAFSSGGREALEIVDNLIGMEKRST